MKARRTIRLFNFLKILGFTDAEAEFNLDFQYLGKRGENGSYIVDTDNIKGLWLKEDCEIDDNGIKAKKLEKDLFNFLTPCEKKAIVTFERNIRLDFPCTPVELLDWAERNEFLDVLASDFIRRTQKRWR